MGGMLKPGRIAAAVLVVSLLAACGSGGDDEADLTVGAPAGAGVTTVPGGTPIPTPAPGSVQVACDALTREEVGSVVGNPVRAADGSGKNCFWGTSVDRGTSISVSITRPAPPQECTALRNALPKEATKEQVNNVGTSAVWSWQPVSILTQGTFLACWQNAIVSVLVTGEKDQAVLRNQATTLAQRVHSRL